ncbi:MAG: hypothetical protein Q4Q06_07235 [Bacteroidota bacterium]|nr:hypothetical protein [Bacteroidota bacterium]
MLKKEQIILFFFLLCHTFVFCQNYASEDFEFIRYLIGNDMKNEALCWAERDFTLEYYKDETKDSINFLRGWAFYSAKQLYKAQLLFDKVSETSSFKPTSLFFSSLCLAYNNKYKQAEINLLNNKTLLEKHGELYSFQLAGYSLLQRDFVSYNRYKQNFSYSSYTLAEREKILDSICLSLENKKAKSPFLSATLSAIVPGLGKIYAGSLGEGISSFITVGSFAGICAENWVKHGLSNWKTILFGSLATVFYIGNIYGSYISVKLLANEYNNNQNLSILYNIHIPLRNTFGL